MVRRRTLDGGGESTIILCLADTLGQRFLIGRGGFTFVATLYQAAHVLFGDFLFTVAVMKRNFPTNRGASAGRGVLVAAFNLA